MLNFERHSFCEFGSRVRERTMKSRLKPTCGVSEAPVVGGSALSLGRGGPGGAGPRGPSLPQLGPGAQHAGVKQHRGHLLTRAKGTEG